ncbi:hypothetical protein AX15_004157 [Amanita polypyramis BW_CC]|nr:hypothetical protein AX15_004157 [Amanita polypyramis BW_CC]
MLLSSYSLWGFIQLCLSFLFSTLVFEVAHAASGSKDGDVQKAVHLRTHSIYAPYIDQDLQNRWWDFGADSYVNTNKHIRLTRAAPSQMGWLWSRLPVAVSDFTIEVEFKVSGESPHLFGDGFAVWLTMERAQPGPIYGNIGNTINDIYLVTPHNHRCPSDKFTGLGIFLDTYANARHGYAFPRVSGMVGDGTTSYDFGSDGDNQVHGACSANFRRTNVVTKLRITILKGKYIDVKMQYKAWDDWTNCFRIENVTLPSNPFLGFSAMTGDVFDAHDIIAITTYSVAPQATSQQEKQSTWRSHDSPSTGMSWFGLFFRIVLFAGLCYGLYYAYQEYNRRTSYGYGGNFRAAGGGFGFGGSGLYENRRHF